MKRKPNTLKKGDRLVMPDAEWTVERVESDAVAAVTGDKVIRIHVSRPDPDLLDDMGGEEPVRRVGYVDVEPGKTVDVR